MDGTRTCLHVLVLKRSIYYVCEVFEIDTGALRCAKSKLLKAAC